MDDLTAQLVWLPTLLLAVARTAGIMLAAPVVGCPVVPARIRAMMSVVIALAAVGRIAQPVSLPGSLPAVAVLLAAELALGALIGYAARLVLVGVQLGAVHIAQQMGLGLSEVFSHAGTEGSGPVTRLFYLLTVMIFLAIGAHRDVLAALMKTFDSVGLMSFSPTAAMLKTVTGMLAISFALALKIAAPMLVAMLLATVAMGLLHRTVPQCNTLSIGLPLRVMLGMLVLAAALVVVAGLLTPVWTAVMTAIGNMLDSAG